MASFNFESSNNGRSTASTRPICDEHDAARLACLIGRIFVEFEVHFCVSIGICFFKAELLWYFALIAKCESGGEGINKRSDRYNFKFAVGTSGGETTGSAGVSWGF